MSKQTNTLSETAKPKLPVFPFPMNMLAHSLNNFTPPSGDFDPKGDWAQPYKMYTLAGGIAAHAGDVKFKRKSLSGFNSSMEIEYTKYGVGGSKEIINSQIQFENDKLMSPEKWKYSTKMFDRKGGAIA